MSLNTRKTLINSKLRDMASKAPPPLIRSSKAFSVEIPEGSNSAKSRRSDVVPNDELDVSGKAGQYHGAELDLDKPLGAHEEAAGLHGAGFAEDHHAPANLQGIEDPHHQDNLAKLPGGDHAPSAKGPTLQADALKDRFAGGDAGHDMTDKGVNEARDALHDNLQGLGQDSLRDNLQGVAQDALHDNLQGVGQDALHDNVQGIAQDSVKNNVQGVGQDALHDNLQGVGNDALSDNKAGIGKDAIKDNLQGVGQDSLKDNRQGVAQDALHDNKAGIPKDAIHDNSAGIGKDNLEDHIVALPVSQGLNAGPSGKATDSAHAASDNSKSSAADSSHGKKKSSVATQVKKSAEEIAHEAEVLMHAKIEKEKKLEEFHGRVDAIRKTVSGINHKLDELDEEEPPKP